MARISPFQPYRYSPAAGPLENLVTQPYDKISPAMQRRYLSLSPYNLVRVILGERLPGDTDSENVYTRSAAYFQDWIAKGILVRDKEPALFAYFQEFTVPDSNERMIRKGFIGLGPVEDYEAQVVHRHEQTLSGPKKDRMQVLEHTRAHFGQIFMLYPDPELAVDRVLDAAAHNEPTASVTDEYGVTHRLWKIADPAAIASIQRIMDGKKLLIADGHHRYETALAFRKNHPELQDAADVMMTFVNMHSPGLKILATHRVVTGLDSFDPAKFLSQTGAKPVADLKSVFTQEAPDKVRIGVALQGSEQVFLIERKRNPGDLDVRVLHQDLLANALGISEEAVREEKHLTYVRGLDAALEKVRDGAAQIAFLLEPTTVQQVADTSFSGGVMPQKSTDFYPKLLTGITIYKLAK